MVVEATPVTCTTGPPRVVSAAMVTVTVERAASTFAVMTSTENAIAVLAAFAPRVALKALIHVAALPLLSRAWMSQTPDIAQLLGNTATLVVDTAPRFAVSVVVVAASVVVAPVTCPKC